MRTPPSYIAQSGVIDAPPDFPWKGQGSHFGPSQGTKVHEALAKLTTRGIATVAALTLEWLVWRLHKTIDFVRYLAFADSVIAWEIDRRYRNPLQDKMAVDTPTNQALRDGVWLARMVPKDDYWDYPTVDVPSTASLVSVTKQVLPPKSQKAFLKWLEAAMATAAKLDPGPGKQPPIIGDFGNDRDQYRAALRPYFGQPLPREALDPTASYTPEQRDPLLAKFLAGLDWKMNPFLRSPDEMKKLGFEGTPYQL